MSNQRSLAVHHLFTSCALSNSSEQCDGVPARLRVPLYDLQSDFN